MSANTSRSDLEQDKALNTPSPFPANKGVPQHLPSKEERAVEGHALSLQLQLCVGGIMNENTLESPSTTSESFDEHRHRSVNFEDKHVVGQESRAVSLQSQLCHTFLELVSLLAAL
jgi:hypothetical protein